VIGVQLTRNSAGLSVLNLICRSRLFGGRIIRFSFPEESAATAWAQCFAKMDNLVFSSSLIEEKKPSGDAGMTTGLSTLNLMEHSMQLDEAIEEPKQCTLKRVNAKALLCNEQSECSESDSESDIVSAEFVEVGGCSSSSNPLRSMPYGKNLCCADLCRYYQKMVANCEIGERCDETPSDYAELPKSLGYNSGSSTTVNEANLNEFPSFDTDSLSSWD
jgi:hypothetical protein